MAVNKQDLDAFITTIEATDEALAAAVGTLAKTYQTVSDDIKTILQILKDGGNVDLSAELAKLQNADAEVQTAIAGIAGVTSKAQADDQTMNPGGSSNFGEAPKN